MPKAFLSGFDKERHSCLPTGLLTVAASTAEVTPGANLGSGDCPSCDRNNRAAQQRFERSAGSNRSSSSSNSSSGSAASARGAAGGGKVPNPYGKKGGPNHQKEVRKIEKDIRSRGLKSQREYMIKTPGGAKSKRFVDVVGVKGNKVVEMHQVGKKNKNGTPVSRERKANDDIKKATGKDTKFHPIK